MDTPRQAGEEPSDRVPGRLFVPLFVAALAFSVGMALFMAQRLRPVVDAAHRKTFPMDISVEVRCDEGRGLSVELSPVGHCRQSDRLVLRPQDTGVRVSSIAYAIVSDVPTESALVGQFAPTIDAVVPLASRSPGPHRIVFVISDQDADTHELTWAIGQTVRSDANDRLVKAEQYATTRRNRGAEVRTLYASFVVDPAER